MLKILFIENIDLPYIKIWIFLTLFLIFSSTFFPIIGQLIIKNEALKLLKKEFCNNKFNFYLLIYSIRVILTVFPLFITNFFVALKDIILLLIIMGLISAIINLLINIYFYKSFVFLILSIADIVVTYISLIYSFIVKKKKFIYCKGTCTILAALIIMIPLFIQIAYYVGDAIDRYASKTHNNPENAMACVVGFSISFAFYIVYSIIFILYPTFIACLISTK